MSKFDFFKFIFCFGFVIWNFGFLCAKHSMAQSVGLSISPPVVEVLLAPTKAVNQVFVIKNQGNSTTVIPTIHFARPSDDLGHVTIDPTPVDPSTIPLVITSSPPLGQPIEIGSEPLPITLSLSGASTDIPIDSYLALVVQAAPSTDLDQASSNLAANPGISSLLLVTLTPSSILPIHLEITRFDPPLWHDSTIPLSLPLTLTNRAPVMLRPHGEFAVFNPQGKPLATSTLTPTLILGTAARSQNLSFSPRWYQVGPHRFHLTITTEGGSTLTQTEKIVWLFPFRPTMVLVAILILALAVYRLTHTTSP